MAGIRRLSEVGIFVRDLSQAKQFYTRKIGLRVRSSMPKMGYLQLGATKGGEDAGLDLWQPAPSWGSPMYEDGLKQIGEVSGIAFRSSDVAGTRRFLEKGGVKVEADSEGFARFRDPDGNVLFVVQERRPKRRRTGLHAIDWVTVVTRDEARSGEFFRTLGLKPRTVRGTDGEEYTHYRLRPKGTAILPFTPTREMYRNPADYDADIAHIGENTSIAFEVDDVHTVQETLLAKGMRFSKKAEKRDWGGIAARILDPDDNEYMLYEME